MTREEIENWLKKNKTVLSIRAIEMKLDIPSTTLDKVANKRLSLPKKYVERMQEFIWNLSK